jgi:hypothetical protein
MLFKRDGAHGLDAPLAPEITSGQASRTTTMLEANGGDFPNDPDRRLPRGARIATTSRAKATSMKNFVTRILAALARDARPEADAVHGVPATD